MAAENEKPDIDIKPKRPVVWPWIAAVFALLLVVAIWATSNRPEDQTAAGGVRYPSVLRPGEPAPGVAGTAGLAPAPIREYAEFAGSAPSETAAGTMDADHEYTAEGIRRLGDALDSLVEQKPNADSRASLDRFRQSADRIQQDPSSMQHAGTVRNAFTSAVDVIDSIEGAPETADLRAAAEMIDPGVPLLEQRDRVQSFFRRSAEAIQAAASA
ncbi:MAG TPA: hypothetical protein VK911_09890 [Vicinamibacterales bacterium]|nr:hypothetical protein [Vicinamibacterales bacterium]